MLAAEKLGGVLISSQHNFSWLTAGSRSGIDLSREPGAGALLVRRDGKRFLLASRIEMARLLTEELSDKDFEPIEFGWEEEKVRASFLVDRARSLLIDNESLGSDLPVPTGVRTVEGSLAHCRYVLTSSEMDRFRQLGQDAGRAISDLIKSLQPGETETQIARHAADALAAKNIHVVVNLVAADERIKKYRHPVPTEKRWERVLMVVVCARRNGLIVSLTRIVSAGKLSDDLKHRTAAAARVNAQLLSSTRPGTTGAELYAVATRAYEAEGFQGEEHLHHQGGATGYRTRDWVAHPACEEQVHLHQAFAWNPSITGTKVEETAIVVETGTQTITSTADWPQISVRAGAQDIQSPNVLII